MKIAIYQIDFERDRNGVAFRDLDSLGRLQGDSRVDSSIYNKVYSGQVDCSDLEDVYKMFNERKPEDYRQRSLSVGDVVEVLDSAGCPDLVGKIRFYNSSTAFEEISFTDEKRFLEEIDDSRDVGRCIQIDDFRGKHIPSVDKGFYFCDDIGFEKVSFEPDKTVDLWGLSQDQAPGKGQKRLDDLIKACETAVSSDGYGNKSLNQELNL